MRFIAILVPAIVVLLVIYILVRGPQPPSPEQTAARQSVETLAREHLAALAGGDVARWTHALGSDGRFVAATETLEVAGVEDAAALVAREPGMPLHESGPDRGWRIGVSRRARLAWAVSTIGRGPTSEGPEATPLRVTAAWYLDDKTWKLMLEHHSRPATEEDVALRSRVEAAPAHGLAARAVAGEKRGIFGDRPHPMVRAFLKRIGHLSRFRVDRETMLLGPTDGEFAAGDSAAKALLADWESRYGPLTADRATMMSWTPRRIGLGWIVADLTAKLPGPGGTVRLRLSAVYRERGEDDYALVLAHLCDPTAGAAAGDSLEPAALRTSVAARRVASAARTSSQPAPVARSATSTW